MANKKLYSAPSVEKQELAFKDVLLDSNNDNLGKDEDWSGYMAGGAF